MHRWHIQYLGSTELPSFLTELEMETFFSLSDEERTLIQSRYKPNPRIAVAIQLGFLKMAGRPLSAFKALPAKLLSHIGTQLNITAPTLATLRAMYKRRSTLYEHQVWAIRTLGFTYDTERQRAMLLATIRKHAVTARSIDMLIDVGNQWLYEHKIIHPGDRPIRDIARRAYAESEQSIVHRIHATIPSDVRESWIAALLQRCEDGRTHLEWLQLPPRRRSKISLRGQLEKLDFLKALNIQDYELAGLPLEKQKHYAHRVRSQRPARYRKLQEPRLTLDTVCFLKVTMMQLTDTVIELAGRLILNTVGAAKRSATTFTTQRANSYKDVVTQIKQIAADSALSDQAARARIVELCNQPAAISFPTHAATVRHLLSEPGTAIRSLLAELTRLDLQATTDEDTLTAVKALKEIYAKNETSLPKQDNFPCPKSWRNIVEGEDRAKALRGLEAATLLSLRKGLKRGSVWIPYSENYRDRNRLLISPERWAAERTRHYARLQLPMNGQGYLTRLCRTLEQRLETVAEHVRSGQLTIVDGIFHLPQLTAELVPKEVSTRRDEFYGAIGNTQLPDVMLEIDSLTHFTTTILGRAPNSESEILSVYGALLAHGTALDAAGIASMMPQVTAEQVLAAMHYVEEEGALRSANQTIVAFQRRFPITKAWGDGTLASADLTSLDVSKHLWNARRDPRRHRPAIGTYTHLGDFWSLFNDMPLLLNERQAGAAIEGAIRQKDVPVATLCVDTHGYSEFGMAVGKLLSLDVCPRLKRLQERKLFVPNNGVAIPDELKDVIDSGISLRAIIKEWDTLVRIAASIDTGETSAVIALAHYGSVASGDAVHTAGVHLGRLVRSLFLCDYLTNAVFRRTIHRILAHGESVHTLQRAIHDGTPSKPRGRRPEELIAISGALTLLTNLCLTWNTMNMQRVLNDWRTANPQLVTDDWLKHITPAHSGKINTRGIFSFPVDRYRERLFQHRPVNTLAA